MADDFKEEKIMKEETVKSPRSTEKCVIYAIKPILLFENAMGIFRVSITDTTILGPVNKKMKLAGILATIVATVIVFYRTDIVQNLLVSNKIMERATLVDLVEDIPSVVILTQYISAVISTLFFLDEPTIKIISTFTDLDSALRINLNVNFYTNCRSMTIKCLILLVVVHGVFTAADLTTDDEFEAFKLISMLLYYIQDLEIYAFCKMVGMLKSRVKVINKYLKKFVHEKDKCETPIFIVNEKENEPDKQFNFIGRISSSNMKIRDLAATYDTIGNTCCLINDVFKFQIFMNLVSTFVFILITIWTSLYYFRTPGSRYGPLVTSLSWCILTVISVAIMSYSCESVLTVRSNTKALVNEIIMDYNLPKTMRIQAKVFMELIEAWPLRIFVYDMFTVDIKLMLKFVSVATTYLIVIIQISHFV